MTYRPVPDSLLDSGLEPVWEAVRRQLDRFGARRRGTIARPPLSPRDALTLESLLGHKPNQRLDLARLEEALVQLKIGETLCGALTRLGHPPSEAAALRRAARVRSCEAREALNRAVASWEEPWASEWADGIVRTGLIGDLDRRGVEDLVANVRSLLDHLDQMPTPSISRTELAAKLFASTHALDKGKLAGAVTQGLQFRVEGGFQLKRRALWEAAGILADRVSAPVLTWSLPAVGATVLDEQTRSAFAGGLPLHISLFALQRYPITVPEETPILVVENPRLVEAAAERKLPVCVITSNGNPSTAVTTLLQQVRESGASIWYHGDFDASGITMCRRMHQKNGARPWMMDASDYEDAIDLAEKARIRLEHDPDDCGATPWDPELQVAFRLHQRVIHEEFVLDRVLDRFSDGRR